MKKTNNKTSSGAQNAQNAKNAKNSQNAKNSGGNETQNCDR